jgi:hypothetical protein
MKYNTLLTLQNKYNAEYRTKDQIIFGNYQGYSFYLQLDDRNFSHTLIVNAKTTNNDDVKSQLKAIAVDYQNIDGFKYENRHVMIHFLPYVEEKKTIDSIIQVFDKICQYLEANDFANSCDLSNNKSDVELYETVKKEKMFLSNEYVTKWNKEVEQKYLEEEKKPFNLPLSLIVSILFTLPGSALWILMYRYAINYSGAIGGALIMIGAFIGYTIISKKLDKKALINVTIISTAIIIITQFFAFNTFIYYLLVNNKYFPVSNYFDTLQYYSIIFNVVEYPKTLIFSICEAIILATIVLTFYARAVYVRRINAYGAKKVVTDIIYTDDDDNDEDQTKTSEDNTVKKKKKEIPYDDEE